jgi:hypothetical protein
MKIFTKITILSTGLLLGATVSSFAQTPLGGFMQGKKGGGVSFSYTGESYKKVFLFPDEIDETPVFKDVTTSSFNVYGTYGLSDKLDVIFNVPFIRSTGSGTPAVLNDLGFSNSRGGVQDLSAFLKYEFAKKGDISLQGSFGVTTPLGDYRADDGLQSIIAIGNRATTFNAIGLAHYKNANGLFITGQLGYSLRTTEVPDAVLSQIKVGYAASRFYVDGFIGNQTSTGGVDILRNGFTGSFPATKVNYTRAGGTIYAPIDPNIGLSLGGGGILDGRNVGKSYYTTVGVTYNFIYRPLSKLNK